MDVDGYKTKRGSSACVQSTATLSNSTPSRDGCDWDGSQRLTSGACRSPLNHSQSGRPLAHLHVRPRSDFLPALAATPASGHVQHWCCIQDHDRRHSQSCDHLRSESRRRLACTPLISTLGTACVCMCSATSHRALLLSLSPAQPTRRGHSYLPHHCWNDCTTINVSRISHPQSCLRAIRSTSGARHSASCQLRPPPAQRTRSPKHTSALTDACSSECGYRITRIPHASTQLARYPLRSLDCTRSRSWGGP